LELFELAKVVCGKFSNLCASRNAHSLYTRHFDQLTTGGLTLLSYYRCLSINMNHIVSLETVM